MRPAGSGQLAFRGHRDRRRAALGLRRARVVAAGQPAAGVRAAGRATGHAVRAGLGRTGLAGSRTRPGAAAGWLCIGMALRRPPAAPGTHDGGRAAGPAGRRAHLRRAGRAGTGVVLERGPAAGVHRAVALPDHRQPVAAGAAVVHAGRAGAGAHRRGTAAGRGVRGAIRRRRARHGGGGGAGAWLVGHPSAADRHAPVARDRARSAAGDVRRR